MDAELAVVGCFLEYKSKFVLLKRKFPKPEEWGIVAGKVEHNETKINAMIREIKEEIGYNLNANQLIYIGNWCWNFDHKRIVFYTYKALLNNRITIKINQNEHTQYAWIKPCDCIAKNDLIHGLKELTKYVYC